MKYPVLVYIFLSLFLVASILQLIFAFQENQNLRRKEKVFCMFFLGLAALFALPNHPLIYISAFLGMIGDICVLRKKTFNFGVVAFFLGHVGFICESLYVITGASNLKWYHQLLFVGVYLLTAFIMFMACRKAKNHSKIDKIGQALYFAILVTYIPVFIVSFLSVGSYMYLSLIGAFVFIVSDSILVITHFGFKFKRYDFYIMFTYLVAELLIISGLILTII